MQESHTSLAAGQHVTIRDERWSVLHTERFESTLLLRLRGIEPSNRHERQSLLGRFEEITVAPKGDRLRVRSRRGTLSSAAAVIADAPPWQECWTAADACIDLRPWQLEPAMAAVTGTTRILLADSVGLGKTIQAGLIIQELSARALAHRVLILTPPSLRKQWEDELRSRFGLAPVIFDPQTLATTVASLPPDINPWKTAAVIVSSIDLVKRAEVRAALETVAFDVLVVDEAHHVTPGTDRGAVVSDLAARTPWLVLATATPHSGDDAAYDYLTNLGHVGTDALRVFRRTQITERRPRRSRILMVSPSADEIALLDATREYARALALHGRGGGGALVGSVIARRAASSALAVVRTLTRRTMLLNGGDPGERQPPLPWDEADAVGDDVADEVLAEAGLADVGGELEWLRRLTGLAATAATYSSKISVLRRLLRRTREPLLVFSEYRDVVLQLTRALEDLTTIASIHGGLTPRERQRAVDAFNTGKVRTLVATDAAGEGLNLHTRCRLVVNVELPWTPRRLEQRIGRVDRIGQLRRVHALHLAHRGSYEGTVIARLERRRARAAAAQPSSHASWTHADASMRRRLRELAHDLRPSARAAICSSRRTRPAASVIMIYVTSVLAGSGQLVERHITALRVEVGSTRRLTRHVVRALTRNTNIRAVVIGDVQQHVSSARATIAPVSEHLVARLSALIATLDRKSPGGLWQASLFDPRVEHDVERHRAARASLKTHFERQSDIASQLQQLHADEPQLVAAWLSGW